MTDYSELPLPEVFDMLSQIVPDHQSLYLVGGAVRDVLMGETTHDLDFIVQGNVRPIARKLANKLDGAFYMLDNERETARVIYISSDGETNNLDFARMRYQDLRGDLQGRDFTVNAMALDVKSPGKLIDPLGGAQDLRSRKLRTCSETAFQDDPLRVLRGVRFAISLEARISTETLQLMADAAPLIARVSAERQRDELFRMLGGKKVALAIRLLDRVGILRFILPELDDLKNVAQPSPHVSDVWEHTVSTLRELETLLTALGKKYHGDNAANVRMASAVMQLGRFRGNIDGYLEAALTANRRRRALLFLAALYHDVGKPSALETEKDGTISFLGHEALGAELVTLRARTLALSQQEIKFLRTMLKQLMRVHHLSHSDKRPGRRQIHRYWRDVSDVGVGICILSLADTLATYQNTLLMDVWQSELDVCRDLLRAWWEESNDIVTPPRLLTGVDLQETFNLSPGPIIGQALMALAEAQACGEVLDREAAVKFVENWLGKETDMKE